MIGQEPAAEIGGLLERDCGAGVLRAEGSGDIAGDSRDCKMVSKTDGSKNDCSAAVSSRATSIAEGMEGETGRVVEREEAEGSGVMVLEVWVTESKSAPADSRSIVWRPSNPSSIGRARARHSSGARLERLGNTVCQSNNKTYSNTSAGKRRKLVQ